MKFIILIYKNKLLYICLFIYYFINFGLKYKYLFFLINRKMDILEEIYE